MRDTMNTFVYLRLIPSLAGLFFFLASTTYVHTQVAPSSSKKELLTIINSDQNPEVRFESINEYLENFYIESDEEITNLFEKGNKLLLQMGNDSLKLQFHLKYAKKLATQGAESRSLQEYKTVIKKASNLEISQYESLARLHIANSYFRKSDYKEAEKLLNDELSKIGSNDDFIKGLILCEISKIKRQTGYNEASMKLIDSSIYLLRLLDNNIELANSHLTKGRLLRQSGQTKLAKEQYIIALDLLNADNKQVPQAAVLNNLGNIEHVSGNYDKAIAYYVRSINIKKRLGDLKGLCVGYHNIGAIKFDLKDWETALSDFEKSNQIAVDIDFKILQVHNKQKIGLIYIEQDLLEKAIFIHQEALDISKEIGFTHGIIQAYDNLGKDYLLLNRITESYETLFDGLALARELGRKPLIASLLISIANTYIFDNKMNAQNDLILTENIGLGDTDIEKYLKEAKVLADEMNNAEFKISALEGLHLLYNKTQDKSSNLYAVTELLEIKDTLFSKERNKFLADWETKYKTAEQQTEIIKLEAKNKIQQLQSQRLKTATIGAVSFLSLLMLFGYYFLKQQNVKKQAKQKELFRSKLSSDLHDDVGAILTGLAMQSEILTSFVDQKTKKSVDRLAEMSRDAMTRMRDTVWAIDSRKDKLEDLNDRMLDFAEENLIAKDIQLIVLNDLRNNTKKVNPELRQDIYLIFKEAIINILKYSSATEVKVDMRIEKDKIKLSVADNGEIDKNDIKTSGMGISNMKMRAEKHSGKLTILTNEGFEINLEMML